MSREGIATNPAKTEKVMNWPVPVSKRDMQQFLGHTSYYQGFVQGYATIAKPLHQRTRLSGGPQQHKMPLKI